MASRTWIGWARMGSGVCAIVTLCLGGCGQETAGLPTGDDLQTAGPADFPGTGGGAGAAAADPGLGSDPTAHAGGDGMGGFAGSPGLDPSDPSPGLPGVDGAGDPATEDGGGDGDERLPPCIDDPNDVVILGDSYVDWITHTFLADLAAETGQHWPSYAVGGNSMATGGAFGRIPDQYRAAIGANPDIQLLVMDGGGNDILVPDTVMFPRAGECTHTPDAPMIEDCRAVVETALDMAESMMDDAADAGVRDVVYFFYPHIPGGGLISGPHPNEILDYALPRAREVCESALERTGGRMKCHFIDMVPVFDGKTGLFADAVSEAGDGVHPNSSGSKVMAAEVRRVMEQACLARPSGSGCCAPP